MIALLLALGTASAQDATVRMARAPWETGWFQAEVVRELLIELGYTVDKPVTLEEEPFYLAAAAGEIDLWANAWDPEQRLFLERPELLGRVLYTGRLVEGGGLEGYLVDRERAASLGLQTLADLARPDVAAAYDLDGNGKADLLGCPEDWSCAALIDHHLEAYGLTETVEQIHRPYGPEARLVIERAVLGDPVLAYAWTPHWLPPSVGLGELTQWLEVPFPTLPFGTPEMLTTTRAAGVEGCPHDPCVLGFPTNHLVVAAGRAFLEGHPRAASLLASIEIPLEDVLDQNVRMLEGEDGELDVETHARAWLRTHRKQARAWVDAARRASSVDPEPLVAEVETRPLAGRHLIVSTRVMEPFVEYEQGRYTGFLVELWDAIAERAGATYELEGVDGIAKLLDEVARGEADVGLSGLSVTAERETRLDFTHPYYNAGLRILVPVTDDGLMALGPALAQTATSPEFLQLLGVVGLILLVAAHLIWLSERRVNDEFPEAYLPGVWEGVWWAAVTMTTVGYGDRSPRGVLGRVVGIVWMLAGYFVLAYFIAGVTSSLAVDTLTERIEGPEDLVGRKVATQRGTVAADWLVREGILTWETDELSEAYDLLERGEVEAVVFDGPVLVHHLHAAEVTDVALVGASFLEQDYALALPQGSEDREPLNAALLELKQDGTYRSLVGKWFGR
jgi:ABC-type proline/glycine betaine transport system substrate-binding protein/voltage-gated potassium channel Kch